MPFKLQRQPNFNLRNTLHKAGRMTDTFGAGMKLGAGVAGLAGQEEIAIPLALAAPVVQQAGNLLKKI